MKPEYQLGITQHMLFPDGMEDAAAHERSLADALSWPEFPVMDLFCIGDDEQMAREAALVRASGKRVVYNCPLLCMIGGCNPNATDLGTIERTRAVATRHLNAADACGAQMMNVASGPNDADDPTAWGGWIDFLAWFGERARARGMRVVIEPFDQSIGKNLLIGPTTDAVRSVELVRERGIKNIGLMVDMGHLPIMGEKFEHALTASRPHLWHVHLGSAVMDDSSHPWYGDCHPPIGIPEGVHDPSHLVAFLRELVAVGYFDSPEPTLTLEMRPYPGTAERASVARAVDMLDSAWEEIDG